MTEAIIKHMKDLPSTHLLGSGTAMCAGCGALSALHEIYDVLGTNNVFVNAAGCMTLLSVYPFTPFRGSWLYTAMASAPAGARGIRDALDILIEKKRIAKEEDMDVIVLTGDGSAYGMGLSSTSNTIDLQTNYIYICYDNEGYGNTGQQTSAATPHAAKTATSYDYPGYKKDLFDIWVANKPTYVATVSSAEPLDLAKKIEKAKNLTGTRMIIAMAMCPTGWGFDPVHSIEIGKLAIKTGVFPLKEYHEGKITHTKMPSHRVPVEDYLKLQGRFKHLFEPERDEKQLAEIQARIDNYWDNIPDQA